VLFSFFFTCVIIFNYVGNAICGVRMAESLLVGCNFVSGICKLKSKKKLKNLKRPKKTYKKM